MSSTVLWLSAHGLANLLEALLHLAGGLLAQGALHGGGVEAEGEQQRADLVVEVARQLDALLVLGIRELNLEPRVGFLRLLKAGGHLVEAAIYHGEVTGAGIGQADGEVASGNLRERVAQVVQRAQLTAERPIDSR